jgi:two-component system, NtrC family, sensor kinase
MPGEVNCIFTKVLIPFLEREVGPEGVAELCRAAGRSREYLMADHNWLPLEQASRLIGRARELSGDPDEESWLRRVWEFGMDWKPREERSYLGSYTMGIGDPRGVYEALPRVSSYQYRHLRMATEELGRRHARFRLVPEVGVAVPLWACRWFHVQLARFPTNWGLPRARVVERQCAAEGAHSCVYDVRWQNPPLGAPFWSVTFAGAASSTVLALLLPLLSLTQPAFLPVLETLALFPALAGLALGFALRERSRRRHTRRLLDLQSEEILFSNDELEKKFRDLETKIEQLSLLTDLSAAVSATLDPEKIYEQAMQRLVDRMGYESVHLFLVDRARGLIRGHRRVTRGREVEAADFPNVELPLTAHGSLVGKVAVTGLSALVDDVAATSEPVGQPIAFALGVASLVMVPLRVKDRVFGVLCVGATRARRFAESDRDLLSAVANHVALAVDKAESFQTIEELSRGLEDKVRVRTEQLRAAHEELQAAYRNLQQTQMQLIQREKMASVGQLVAGVAHELNNPIGFVYSNVSTLEDFVRRLRAMLDVYRALPLPEATAARAAAQWETLKVDYALRYLDSMTQGIREGAERARKIVRDLRVFARADDDIWQPIDLHAELESSLTLLNHLLKDRVTVHRKFGELPAVECVRSQIDQVFLNLLANAAQAISGPGEITIETRQENGTAVVSITDTGSGIAPEVMGRVFDPFFTTKTVGEGTGLGLSISYEIVKKHRGEIRAASPPGQGATFTVRIPVARAA